MWRLFTRR